jgi:hypothetical protein
MSLYNFYRSREWEKFRQVVINERTNNYGEIICEYCHEPIIKAYDCIAHHRIELTEENYIDRDISLNPDNIALVHHSCHNKIHNKLSYSYRQIFIVHGSPLSGKSSWVKDNMNEGDLIIDIDNIWECVSGCDKYIKPNCLKTIVFSVRDNLIDCVKYRKGKWLNAYVISSLPFKNERERLADQLGARIIHIDTDKETCIKRLYDNPDGRDIKQWISFIEDYFEQYELYGK